VELSPADSVKEAIIFGLRLVDGIKLSEFRNRFGVDIMSLYAEAIAVLSREGLIVLENDRLRIPHGKLLVSNQILSQFI
jgi:oxygen-independent coproporphyrinogen-3 oxidase